jgi:hypothetical protein
MAQLSACQKAAFFWAEDALSCPELGLVSKGPTFHRCHINRWKNTPTIVSRHYIFNL